jgi:hypothetical protein
MGSSSWFLLFIDEEACGKQFPTKAVEGLNMNMNHNYNADEFAGKADVQNTVGMSDG